MMARVTALMIFLLALACSDRQSANARVVDDPPRKASAVGERKPACENRWRELEPGLRLRSVCADGEATLVQVEIDPRRWTLDAVRVQPATASAAARESGAAFAINANFFDPQRKTLGVVVSKGKVVQPPHPVSWQSIFYVTDDGKAAIVLPERWAAVRDDAVMAVQAGPRLVANGRATGATRATPSLRSGVCLTADARVIFFATTMRRFYDVDEMTDLATRSEARGGLGCRDAMLFDGGPSAQMYVEGSNISRDGDQVPAFVTARPR